MVYTVGSVPYLNARPLVKQFEVEAATAPVRVLYDVPSRLPRMLDDGAAQAVLVSSVEALRDPRARVANSVSISTQGEVKSVRLFSRIPFAQIRHLALDQSSMTSNALAMIVLAEKFGVEPTTHAAEPNLEQMLGAADAGVLIGDPGMRTSGEGLHVLDLGLAWRELTDLPFVWALWVGREGLTPELAGDLADAERWGEVHRDRVLADAPRETGFTREECADYFDRIMDYRFGESHRQGLREFGRRLVHRGLLDAMHEPEVVSAAIPAAK